MTQRGLADLRFGTKLSNQVCTTCNETTLHKLNVCCHCGTTFTPQVTRVVVSKSLTVSPKQTRRYPRIAPPRSKPPEWSKS